MASFKTSDGCNIAYQLHLSGKPGAPRLALIHSLALGGTIWDGVVQRLSDKVDVLTWDCRGHSASDRMPGPYTPQLFARDLSELMTHIGWESASVAGCSMGGCVALAFAGGYAARLEKLGLIDTTACYGPEAPKQWRERAATAREKGLASMSEFQGTRWFGDAFRQSNPQAVSRLMDIFVANDVNCYSATCEMLGDADLRDLLPAIKAPTAVMVGEEDFATPVAMAEALHQGIAGSTLTVFKGARHITPVERPDDIAAKLSGLLGV